MLTRLNWTFGAQANIFFTQVEAAWFTVNNFWVPGSCAMSLKDIVPHKTKGADITVLPCRRPMHRRPRRLASICLTEQVCVVVRPGQSRRIDYGRSVHRAMAHEIGHFLHHKRNIGGSGHHSRGGVLLSSGLESLSFDKDLVTDFSAW